MNLQSEASPQRVQQESYILLRLGAFRHELL